jgi:hypothetical protein
MFSKNILHYVQKNSKKISKIELKKFLVAGIFFNPRFTAKCRKLRWLPASGPLAGHGGASEFFILKECKSLNRRGGAPPGAAAFIIK